MRRRLDKELDAVLGHQWSCLGFWFLLKDVCPSLAKIVDTTEIYECVWSHDIGETFIGDVSQPRQLSGKHDNKYILEREEMKKMSRNISPKTSKRLLRYFDDFESNVENIEKLEILVAKMIDAMQGNHFALVFGNNLFENGDKINQIVGRTFIRRSNQLLKVLEKQGHKRACQEVRAIVVHHLKYYKKLGVKIDTSAYSK